MAEKLHLEIYTPEGVVLDEDVDEIEGPGFNGAFGVLPQHTSYLVLLKTGVLSYRRGNEWNGVVIEPGYAVVENDSVKVIVPSIESISSINYEKELKNKDEVLEKMKGLSIDSEEFTNLESEYRRTLARIQAYERFLKKG